MHPRSSLGPQQALRTAIERGILRPYGGHWAVKSGRRTRLFQRKFVERFAAAHGFAIEGERVVAKGDRA